MSDDLPKKRIKKTGKRKKKNSSSGQWLLIAGAGVAMVLVAGLGYWLLNQNLFGDQMVTFEHSAGGFSCILPKAPEREPAWEEPGMEAYKCEYTSGSEGAEKSRGYVILYVTMDPRALAVSTPRRALEAAVQVRLQMQKGAILSEREFGTQSGVEYVTFKLTQPNSPLMRGRYFFHRNNVLHFHVLYKGSEDPKETERFFNSIQFVP